MMNETDIKTMMWHAVIDAMTEHVPLPRTVDEREAFERTANRIVDENWAKHHRGDI